MARLLMGLEREKLLRICFTGGGGIVQSPRTRFRFRPLARVVFFTCSSPQHLPCYGRIERNESQSTALRADLVFRAVLPQQIQNAWYDSQAQQDNGEQTSHYAAAPRGNSRASDFAALKA